MVEEVPHRDRGPRDRQVVEVAASRRVEIEPALMGENRRGDAGERLGGRRELDDGRGRHRHAELDVRETEGTPDDGDAALDHCQPEARDAGPLHLELDLAGDGFGAVERRGVRPGDGGRGVR